MQTAKVSLDIATKNQDSVESLGSFDLTSGVESKIDIATRVDKEAQYIIQETISKASPHHKYLGEEQVLKLLELQLKIK